MLAHKTTKEIARDLGASPTTVAGYFADIRAQLGISDRRIAARALAELSK